MSRFLPPIIRNHSCCVDSHDLRLSTEPDGRQLYTYTVIWHDLQQSAPSNSVDNAEIRAASPQFSFMTVPTKQDMSAADMQICKLITPSNVPSSQFQECCCDGPCGKIKPVSEMRVMGLCDHYICRDCAEKESAVEIGDFGCPNVCCQQADAARSHTNDRRNRHKVQEVSTTSLLYRTTWTDKAVMEISVKETDKKDPLVHDPLGQTSMTYLDIFSNPFFLHNDQGIVPVVLKSRPYLCLVNVRLTTFTPLPNSEKVCRQQQIVEIYGDYTMLQTLNALKEYERFSSSDIANRLYYCPSGLINERSSWKQILKNDLLMPITKFGQEDQRIDIIFDLTNR
ncbi:unnamed protein product [Litomosoides sigmodontis]|uniref:RING-type domain-containing protein n=1 Tax=Litomosoides sigmodontis TaxID=42156 RepID=A0A3P6TTK3_LITSI|nr:unnamed protein product [Litomosoides sigmodontis]